MLCYVCSALYKLKPKRFLEKYIRLYIGEPSTTSNVTRDFSQRYESLIVKINDYKYSVKILNCWYDIPNMLVCYIYYKMNVGFCVYDFCCRSNIINRPREY